MADTKPTTETITVLGGCHCGTIRYSCTPKPDDDSGQFSATKCNCTFCQKLGNFVIFSLDHKPEAKSFTLLSPTSREEVGDYTSGDASIHRYFCRKCGTHVWREGSYEFNGETHFLLGVCLATIDQPQDVIDVKDVKMQYFDGLHNNWFGGLKSEPWSGGIP